MVNSPDGSGANSLGDYLRARRELISPLAVGLPEDPRRRVPGLRREEVAMLAGISPDYYLRLEQGRNRNPSMQVLESLARVLQLDEPATAHLLELGTPHQRRPRRRIQREMVTPRIIELIGSIGFPAFVTGRYLDVLTSNPMAIALSPAFRPGVNLLRAVFLDMHEQIHLDHREMAAMFRRRVGSDLDDPRVIELVGELSVASEAFHHAWAHHHVGTARGGTVRIDHPQVGPMELNLSKLTIDETSDQLLVIYHPAESQQESAERLSLLTSLAAPPRSAAQRDAHPATE